MITVPYNDPRLGYAGRWVDFGDSMGCAWQAGQIRFKVSGTTVLNINTVVSGTMYCVVNIDSGPPQLVTFPGTSGAQSVSFTLTSGTHTVVVKLFGLPDGQFNQTIYSRLTSVSLSDGATVSAFVEGPIKLQCVGDSWMSAQNDWPFLLPNARYSIHPIAFGGATASALNSQYDYTSSGVIAGPDVVVDGVIVSSGVNDTWGGVSTASYKASMAALVDKIRVRQPTAKIIMLGAPRNLSAGRPYNQYDTVNSEIAAARENVVFIPVPNELADSLSWNGDEAHINYAGGLVPYASWIDQQIYPILAPVDSDYSMWIKTPSGLTKLSVAPVSSGDIAGRVAFKVPDNKYWAMGFVPVVGGDYPTGIPMIKTADGIMVASSVTE